MSITEKVGGHSVQVDQLPEGKEPGWSSFEVVGTGFGEDELILHWGVGKQNPEEWTVPMETQAKTVPPAERVPGAFQTAFPPSVAGSRKIRVDIKEGAGLRGFQFVLHRKPNDWLKPGSRNFIVDFTKMGSQTAFRKVVEDATKQDASAKVSTWTSGDTCIALLASPSPGVCKLKAYVDSKNDLVLQYGPAGDNRAWKSSKRVTLIRAASNMSEGSIELSGADLDKYLMFVLHDPSNNKWLKDGGRDFALELPPVPPAPATTPSQSSSVNGKQRDEEFAPPPRQASARLLEHAAEATKEDPSAKTGRFNTCGIEVSIAASAQDHECNVEVVVESTAELVFQYGTAGADRAWKSSKRLALTRTTAGTLEGLVAIPASDVDQFLMFVLHESSVNRWYKDGNNDFAFAMPSHPEWDRLKQEAEAKKAAEAAAAAEKKRAFLASRKLRESKANYFAAFELERDCGSVEVSCTSVDNGTAALVELKAWLNPRLGVCTLHFGYLPKPRSNQWVCPLECKEVKWPEGVVAIDKMAGQLSLEALGDQVQGFSCKMPAKTERKDDEDILVPIIGGLGFVFKDQKGQEWFKTRSGGDALVRFSNLCRWKGEYADVVTRIVEMETMWSPFSLKMRYDNCLGILADWEQDAHGAHMRKLPSWNTLVHVDSSQAEWRRMPSMPLFNTPEEDQIKSSKEAFWSWMFVWHRFSFQRLLTWERNCCTQPRMLAATTNQITGKLAELWKEHPRVRMWIRWTLATMGRGGSAGQQIRDQILVIMHGHGIKEIHGTYYEQWHQKLHNNTTPEDIGICRAIIRYLQTGGNLGEYWKVIHEHGMDKERLASYSRPITTEPYMVNGTDVGRLIKDFEDYLGILRSVHDALDLQLALDMARPILPGSLVGKLQDVCNMGGTSFNSLDEGHGKLMKIAHAREEALALLNNKATPANVIKETLILDYSLETQQSVLIQGMSSENRLTQLSDQLKVILTSLVAHMPLEDELQAILEDWTKLSGACASLQWNGSHDSALLLKAMSDHVSRIVGESSDKFQELMGPKAIFLGTQIEAPQRNIDVFVDEVLRGTSLIALSLILQRLEPELRKIAHLPPWQMISVVDKPIEGEFMLIDKMLGVQDKVFSTPTILLSGAVSGEEEVPEGVLGVLVRSAKEAPDILSHCAVRARNFKVLLATCFDPSISQKLADEYAGKWVKVTCKPDGSLTVEEAPRPTEGASKLPVAADQEATRESHVKVKMNLTDSLGCPWSVLPGEFEKKFVGPKSLNVTMLKPKIPAGLALTPQAVALPYGCLQKALTDPANAKVLPHLQDVLGRLQPDTNNHDAEKIFEEAQMLVEQLVMPTALKDDLARAMAKVGEMEGEARLKAVYDPMDAWGAIKGVWASLFALRPWVSLAKAGRSFHDLNMAVLVQELVEAKYAFVLHTVNPFTHDKNDLYGELFAGRGETIVGNYPGRALSFSVKRDTKEPRVIAFPSKSVALHTQACLIFRSDSNGEDLEGFAGAGLFESVCATEDEVGFVRLHRLPIVTDRSYRDSLLKRIAEVGWATEQAFDGFPQDIEGCVDVQDRIFIVQSRPQV